ncbi:MAG: TIGR02996 domain-containing protein [Kofleriaceae bacterium]
MDEAALLAQVYAAPDDDAPRLVYADWLQERGDLRGEFIALQIERARGKARSGARQREDELVARYGVKWAKPLGIGKAYVGHMRVGATFARGFPNTAVTQAITFDPAWSTVRTCNVPPTDARCQVRALRRVTAATTSDIIALAALEAPLPIEELAWGFAFDPKRTWAESSAGEPLDRASAAWTAIRVLALRRLEVSASIIGAEPDPDRLAWLWRAPACRDLDELAVASRATLLPRWMSAIAGTPIRRLELACPAINVYSWQIAMRVVLEARALTAIIYRSTSSVFASLRDTVAALAPGTIASVRVAVTTLVEWDRSASTRGVLQRVCNERSIPLTMEKAAR